MKTFIEEIYSEYFSIFEGVDKKPMIEQLSIMQTGSIIFTQKFEKLHRFFSTAFLPTMIPDFFEGWEQRRNLEEGYIPWWTSTERDEEDDFLFEFEIQGEEVIYSSNGGKITVATPFPKTFYDFVNDTTKAQISLTLKPEKKKEFGL